MLSLEVEHAGKLTFVRVLSGALAIGHRPPLRAFRAMRGAGVTHVTTVLSRAEGAERIGAAAARAGMDWIWIELGSTKSLPQRRRADIAAAMSAMVAVLDAGGRIYLHCSAGIHRTGMITAALMFHLGRDETQVRAILAALRPLTATEVGDARLDWARSFATDGASSP